MPAARYIVTVVKSEALPRAPGSDLGALLSGIPGVGVLRLGAQRAVVTMDASTAEYLRCRYPFLSVEKDVRHRRSAASK